MNAKFLRLLSLTGLLAFASPALSQAPTEDDRIVERNVIVDDSDDDDFLAGDTDGGGDGGERHVRVIRHRTPGMGEHGGPMMGMRMRHGAGMMQALDLTDAQRERMRAIHERQERKGIQARADLKLAGLDMRKLMRAESPSLSAINAQIDKLARMRAELHKSQVASMLEARAVLTADQQKQMRELRMKGMGGGPGRRGPGMGGRKPGGSEGSN